MLHPSTASASSAEEQDDDGFTTAVPLPETGAVV